MNKLVIVFCISFLLINCSEKEKLFNLPSAAKTGVNFTNTLTETDDVNILDYLYFYNGGGVAIGDVNNDNLPDIYFSGNQVKNKLYLNKGNLQFEDITDKANVSGNSTWNTGTIMADVNGDGWLDIYVCAVVGINGFNGHNELFINNQDGTFSEKASEYGLDFDSYSSSAAFFDFDLDGDLDLYLLNHAVHTSESYGKADLRYQRNFETGDKLLRNDDGKFIDISEQAGIFGGINGYGLGLAISDFNLDGYPDIYVGNDFHEDDYYYLNNQNGTFTESLRSAFGHTSRFSMGNDVADINHDGYPDLISLDMLPEEEIPLKSSEGDDNLQTQKMRIEQYGYQYQFTRNMLHINREDGNFTETALMSGIAATDWSWSALFADYNQDGEQDLFIANGIPKRPNDLDFINFISNEQVSSKINNTKLVDKKALKMMPTGTHYNYFFEGKGKLGFQNQSKNWAATDTLASAASAYGDLDNDGDLDLVVSNLNVPATIYENKTNEKSDFIKIKFASNTQNKFAIGAKVYAYNNNILQYKELFTTRGFQSSSENIIHFGFGKSEKIDSLKIVWPNKTFQILHKVNTNQTLLISPENTKPFDYNRFQPSKQLMFKKDSTNLGINFTHYEDSYLDFNREKLIPYKISDRGPAFAEGDLNNDGKKDLFFGGSKFTPSQTYLNKDSVYVQNDVVEIKADSIKENISASIADFNGDGKNDIIIGSGGGDFFGNSKALMDSYYTQSDAGFTVEKLPEIFQNSSIVAPFDYDDDGDLDVFIGGQSESGNFGQKVQSYLLKNENGNFTIDENFKYEGMITDAIWTDFDSDGTFDLIIVGEWAAPRFIKNIDGVFHEVKTPNISGLWQSIHAFDIDEDGDTDYLLGNWGLNTKFNATDKNPLRLYYNDFDNNGQTETITAIYKNGSYYTLENLDGLASQVVSLRKKFNSYTSIAGKAIEEVFDKTQLSKSTILEVNTLASGYLKNNDGDFVFIPFKSELQVAPILDFVTYDFDNNGKNEVLAGGNYFGVKPFHGRFDSFAGALIKNEHEYILGSQLGLNFTQKSIRHLHTIELNNKPYLLVIYNNAPIETYQILNN
ncbi:VCBS repeat-containing protein [Aurantibacter crassamenti]|uniref:VCBS repeat-containing protein n=1 Tax=Aurantibacter crassamenti TaxID=1837375 RepID=UPI00193944DA|nr:VCBS repeat-containing protein [Aurantibacter crassamenti]MBM1104756.1 VCBS repeat-containing protein [Aurantibacter crassamenti]